MLQIGIEGLQAVKPRAQKEILLPTSYTNGIKETAQTSGGVDVEARMVISEENGRGEMAEWMVENLKFSVKKPVNIYISSDILFLFFNCSRIFLFKSRFFVD